MSRFMEIKSKDIEKAFEDERRQYFVGNLKKPQHIPFVKSDNAEMGLTAYDKFTGEPAHRHSVAKEYAYVISGRTQYMDLDTREIYEYHAGDFFCDLSRNNLCSEIRSWNKDDLCKRTID